MSIENLLVFLIPIKTELFTSKLVTPNIYFYSFSASRIINELVLIEFVNSDPEISRGLHFV